jgi:hypothetical protein
MHRDGLIPVADDTPRGRGARLAHGVAVACFALVVVGTFATDLLAPVDAVRAFGVEAEREAARRREARFADGSLAGLVERDLRQRSRVRRLVVDRWARILYASLRWVKPPVVCGPEGWLFVEDRVLIGGCNPAAQITWSGAVMAALDRRFSASGHEFLVLPVPRKATAVAHQLPRGYDPRCHLDGELIAELDRRGLAVIDLVEDFRVLGEKAYHLQGSHWADEGQLAAARRVAAVIGHRGALGGEIRPSERASILVDTDLLRMVGVTGDYQPPTAAARHTFVPWRGRQRLDVQPGPDEPGDIVLLGSSFSAKRRLRGQLEAILGRPVWNGARGGTYPDRVVADFLARGLKGRTVILEAPLHQFLDNAHRRFGPHSFVVDPPRRLLRIRPAFDDELHTDLAVERQLVALEPLLSIPKRKVAHSGDGALSIRIRGAVTGRAAVVVRSSPSHQVRYPWPPGQDTLVLPVLNSRPCSQDLNVLVQPSADGPVGMRIDAVELVSEVVPHPVVELPEAEAVPGGGGWVATINLGEQRAAGPDAVLMLRLALQTAEFDGRLRIAVVTDDGEPRFTIDYGDLSRGSLIVTSLRELAGRRVARIEIIGNGAVPENVLTRSTLRLGREPASVGEGDGLHLDGAAQGQRADLEG